MKEWLLNFAQDLIGRVQGPLSFRLILQPTVAIILAVRAGVLEAREMSSGNEVHPKHWHLLLRGILLIIRLVIAVVVIDWIYQFYVVGELHGGESFTVSLILAVIPFFVVRALTRRIALRVRRPKAQQSDHPA